MRGLPTNFDDMSHFFDFSFEGKSGMEDQLKPHENHELQQNLVENEQVQLQYASTENFKQFMAEIKENYDDEFKELKIHHDRVCREIITKVEKEYNLQVKKMDIMLHNVLKNSQKNKSQIQIIKKKEEQIKTRDEKIEELKNIIKKKKRKIKRQSKEIDKWIQMKIEDIQIEDFRKKNQDFTKIENRNNS